MFGYASLGAVSYCKKLGGARLLFCWPRPNGSKAWLFAVIGCFSKLPEWLPSSPSTSTSMDWDSFSMAELRF